MTQASYVYGVVRAGADVEGIELVVEGALAALVAPVSLAEFGEAVLHANLNDRAWLETKARTHEDVLQTVARTATVVPLRFGTICHDAGAVRALLAERRESLTASLDRVEGCVELGLKIWWRPEPEAVEAAGGRAYLEARLAARRRADAIRDAVRQAHERVLAHAEAGVVNRPQSVELTGRTDRMLLNAAYLVRDGGEALAAEVDRLRHEYEALELELTGPWPPHNFVDEAPA